MMEKVILTKDQANELEAFKNLGHSLADWVNEKNDPREPYSIIHALSLDEMARLLYADDAYEIVGPEFQKGDKVIKVDGTPFGMENERIWEVTSLYEQRIICEGSSDNLHPLIYKSGEIRHATPEEIYWLHDLGRDCVNDFRIGDIFIYTHGTTYRLADNIEEDMEDTATIHDAIRWSENGNLKGIYPAEQFKPFKGDAE